MELQNSVQLTVVYYAQPAVTYGFMPEEAQRLSNDFSSGATGSGKTASSGTYQVINSDGKHYAVFLDFAKINHINPTETN